MLFSEYLKEEFPKSFTERDGRLTFPSNAVYHDHDTVEHFDKFTMDTVMSECKEYTPDLLKLLIPTCLSVTPVAVADTMLPNSKR